MPENHNQNILPTLKNKNYYSVETVESELLINKTFRNRILQHGLKKTILEIQEKIQSWQDLENLDKRRNSKTFIGYLAPNEDVKLAVKVSPQDLKNHFIKICSLQKNLSQALSEISRGVLKFSPPIAYYSHSGNEVLILEYIEGQELTKSFGILNHVFVAKDNPDLYLALGTNNLLNIKEKILERLPDNNLGTFAKLDLDISCENILFNSLEKSYTVLDPIFETRFSKLQSKLI